MHWIQALAVWSLLLVPSIGLAQGDDGGGEKSPEAESGDDEKPGDVGAGEEETSESDGSKSADSEGEPPGDEPEDPDGDTPPVEDAKVPAPTSMPPAPAPVELPPLPPLPPLPNEAAVHSPAVKGPVELTFGGLVAFDWFQYVEEVGDLAPPARSPVSAVAMVRIVPRLKLKYRAVRAVAELEYRHDFVDSGRGGRLIVREALVGLKSQGFRLEAGALLPRWGKMDVQSPTDNLVAWDYEELFEPEPLPVPGISLGYARGPVSAEVTFVPAFRASRFRKESPSRWDATWGLPRQQTVPFALGDLTFDSHYDRFEEPVLPGNDPALAAGFDLGARLDFFLQAVDLGLSFAMTRDKRPSYNAFRATNTTDADGDGQLDHLGAAAASLEITPYHERLLVPGLDLAVTAGRFVFKGEAAYFHTADPDASNCLIDDPYIRYALGAELMLPSLVGSFGLALRVQYSGDLALSSQEKQEEQAAACPDGQVITQDDPDEPLLPTDYETGFQGTPSIRHPYTHAIFWNLNLGFTPSLALDLRGMVDVAGDAFLTARLSYELLERLRITGGALVMLATGEDTFFSPYAHNSRVELGLSYRF